MAHSSIVKVQLIDGQSGAALLAVLILIAILSLGLERALTFTSIQAQREEEAEYVFIGEQFKQAIKAYYLNPAGNEYKLPGTLEDLLHDPRRLGTTRYLRKIFYDPLTGSRQWGVVKGQLLQAPFGLPESTIQNRPPSSGVIGIYSLSKKSPIRQIYRKSGSNATFEDWPMVIDVVYALPDKKGKNSKSW